MSPRLYGKTAALTALTRIIYRAMPDSYISNGRLELSRFEITYEEKHCMESRPKPTISILKKYKLCDGYTDN